MRLPSLKLPRTRSLATYRIMRFRICDIFPSENNYRCIIIILQINTLYIFKYKVYNTIICNLIYLIFNTLLIY